VTASTGSFLSGAIERFYGQPWSIAERLELFEWMAACDLDTYLYAPKDDWHHRALWRQPYDSAEREFCDRVTEVRRRPLLHALWRGIWDLRQELDALERRT
jgi:hypothetical protein